MASVELKVGDQKILWTSDQKIFEALFATISYRLEPGGKGSRFPVLLGILQEDSLPHDKLQAGREELISISKELQQMPIDRAVSSIGGAEKLDVLKIQVNPTATNVYDLFVTPQGTPMLTELKSILLDALSKQSSITVLFHGRTRSTATRFSACVILIFSALGIYGQLQKSHEEGTFEFGIVMVSCIALCFSVLSLFSPGMARKISTKKWLLVTTIIVGPIIALFIAFLLFKKVI